MSDKPTAILRRHIDDHISKLKVWIEKNAPEMLQLEKRFQELAKDREGQIRAIMALEAALLELDPDYQPQFRTEATTQPQYDGPGNE